jgi:hypothetical protein
MRIFAYIFLNLVIAAPALSLAADPLEDLRRGVDKGIQILEDSRYEDASLKKVQQQKLWEVTLQIFDFREFSRRVLASNWTLSSAVNSAGPLPNSWGNFIWAGCRTGTTAKKFFMSTKN